MKLEQVLLIISIFILGFISASLISNLGIFNLESPFSNGNLGKGSAPSDFIQEEQIRIYDDRVVIYIDDVSLSKYAATGSMKPVFDKGANGLRIAPTSEDDIQVGDLISFKSNGKLIIHRVIEKGIDNKGTYFVPKGDNSVYDDGKIRFKDIKYITVGVIW